ncbi:putative transcription factor RL9 [Morella rubra]|uniref:Putative transcription factor RL9 n=1 Tax=Morella rubra TaxID=262757 RepID=A0A6A1VK33_9ROSI|nr:putative transcription factor RL9 [Morella rubra]
METAGVIPLDLSLSLKPFYVTKTITDLLEDLRKIDNVRAKLSLLNESLQKHKEELAPIEGRVFKGEFPHSPCKYSAKARGKAGATKRPGLSFDPFVTRVPRTEHGRHRRSLNSDENYQTLKNRPKPLSGSTLNNNRRKWTQELHAKFVEALNFLGGHEVATPKHIRQVMLMEGLTNDQVKSHLQVILLFAHFTLPYPVQLAIETEVQTALQNTSITGHFNLSLNAAEQLASLSIPISNEYGDAIGSKSGYPKARSHALVGTLPQDMILSSKWRGRALKPRLIGHQLGSPDEFLNFKVQIKIVMSQGFDEEAGGMPGTRGEGGNGKIGGKGNGRDGVGGGGGDGVKPGIGSQEIDGAVGGLNGLGSSGGGGDGVKPGIGGKGINGTIGGLNGLGMSGGGGDGVKPGTGGKGINGAGGG